MSKVSIIKCTSYDAEKVYAAVKRSLELIDFKIKDKKILLKPNILAQHPPERAVTTNPSVVEAAIRIFQDMGNDVIIGESQGFYKEGGTEKGFEISGIKNIAEKYSVKTIAFEKAGSFVVEDNNNVILKRFNLAKTLEQVDLVVSLPKLKTHSLMKYTGAIKNMYGCVPGGLKQQFHRVAPKDRDFADLLLDIFTHVKPGLAIMDAIIGMEGNGPGAAGKPRLAGYVLASENCYALDFFASKLIGFDPMEVWTNRKAVERGLFDGDYDVVGDDHKIIDYKKPITPPSWFPYFIMDPIYKMAQNQPYVIKDRCKSCGICIDSCPVKAIHWKDKTADVNPKNCIHCYCCHELCPYEAIEFRQSKLIKFLKKIRDKLIKTS